MLFSNISPPPDQEQLLTTLISHHSGFKAEHSVFLAVTEALNTARASDFSSVLILIDLSSAFDIVNQEFHLSVTEFGHLCNSSLLVQVLRDWKVPPGPLEIICLSTMSTTGVPSTFVLCPLLFSIYTRSLGSVKNSHGFFYYCYTDNTQLLLSVPGQ